MRYWDKAGTLGGGKRTAGVLMHTLKNKRFLITDVTKGQWDARLREQFIKNCCTLDNERYKRVKTWVEQEPGSGGKESAESTIANLAGFSIQADRVTGDKVTKSQFPKNFINLMNLINLIN